MYCVRELVEAFEEHGGGKMLSPPRAKGPRPSTAAAAAAVAAAVAAAAVLPPMLPLPHEQRLIEITTVYTGSKVLAIRWLMLRLDVCR